MLMLLSSLLGCADREPGTQEAPNDVPTQITYEYQTTQTQAGVKQWELWGESAERFADDPTLNLNVVRMIFYEEGLPHAELTSNSGRVDEGSYDTVAIGDVVLVTEDGRTLKSEILYWDNARELIHTDAFVHFTDGDKILTGYGLETDPNLTKLVLKEQVQGSQSPQGARETTGSEEERP